LKEFKIRPVEATLTFLVHKFCSTVTTEMNSK